MKILFVDDDKFLSNMYVQKFEKVGFDVVKLENAGGNFVDEVDKIKPDLISMDIIMPIISGFDAVKLLKSDERTKNIPIIGFDNLGSKKDVERMINLGAIDYLLKAIFTPSEVVMYYSNFLNNPKEYKPQYLNYHYNSKDLIEGK